MKIHTKSLGNRIADGAVWTVGMRLSVRMLGIVSVIILARSLVPEDFGIVANAAMIYSFFEPDLARNSLGTHIILDHIAIAREADLPYVYLGYWVPGSPKMGYKAKFSGLEIYKNGTWVPVDDPSAHEVQTHPLSTDPIAEQVANISLPDLRR